MNVTLPPDNERLVKERVERGEYPSAAELVGRAVQQFLAPLDVSSELPAAKGQTAARELQPMILLDGSLPANWKDDIYCWHWRGNTFQCRRN